MVKEYVLVSVRCADSAETLHKPSTDLAAVERQRVFYEARSGGHYEHYIAEREVGEWKAMDRPVAEPTGLRVVK